VAQDFNHYETKAAAPQGAVPPDRAAAAVAARQYGVITLRQLEECGLGPGAVQRRVAARRLQRLWRGVYAFGHSELRLEGRLLGAVLACGRGAVLSHRSAADRWGILPTARAGIDVTVATRGGRPRRSGIDLHCARHLDVRDVTKLVGIPITTPARTLVDLCAVVPARKIEKAFEQAHVLRLIVPGAIEAALAHSVGRKTAALRRLLLIETSTSTLTRSELEEAFLALCRRGGLPDPEVNVRLHGYEVDFLWRKQRRVVELDGYAFHSGRQAFGRDRRKDIDLELAGFPVTRFTHYQVMHEPGDTLRRTSRLVLGQ
jgi:very-short-patch-repair endonuclease/predicted transcriptional regulator of viral defense system